jgi:hypothetical protein
MTDAPEGAGIDSVSVSDCSGMDAQPRRPTHRQCRCYFHVFLRASCFLMRRQKIGRAQSEMQSPKLGHLALVLKSHSTEDRPGPSGGQAMEHSKSQEFRNSACQAELPAADTEAHVDGQRAPLTFRPSSGAGTGTDRVPREDRGHGDDATRWRLRVDSARAIQVQTEALVMAPKSRDIAKHLTI